MLCERDAREGGFYMVRTSAKILLLSVGLLCLFVASPKAQNITTQLVIILDGSGSISNQDFKTMIEGIARNLEDPGVVPRNGTVEFGLVQFSSNCEISAWAS
jgi:hypothetical protein